VSAVLSAPRPGGPPSARSPLAPWPVVLALTATAAVAAAAAIAAALVLAVHGQASITFLAGFINQQNQTAKTAGYLVAFAIVLPLAAVFVPRAADRLAAGPGGSALGAAAALLAGGLALVPVAVRVLDGGLAAVLGALAVWALAGAGLIAGLRAPGAPHWRERLAGLTPAAWGLAALAGLAGVLSLTAVRALHPAGLLVGLALAGAAALTLALRPVIAVRPVGIALEVLVVLGILLAVPDVVVFHASPGPPSLLAMPGIVQSQHDFFLGPVNQLLSRGALLVNAPGSQYGVGDLYFLAAWFHLTSIGYGSFALLDGILTALFYAGGYALLRLAGVGRWTATLALTVALTVLVYHLQYPVGVLPEMGPLRFGAPLLVILGELVALRRPAWHRAGRAVVLATVGVASVWSVEALAYTLATLAGLWGLELALMAPQGRRHRLRQLLARALAAVVIAQVIFAAATLAGSGSLPHWGQYFAYVHSFLLGGRAGEVTYGFDRFSPALAQGALLLTLAAGVILAVRRDPGWARAHATRLIALGATTTYAVIVFSYTDNRSSTYLLPYLGLPALVAVTIALDWVARAAGAPALRRGALAFAAALVAIMVAAAWPTIGGHFEDSALAHARPGGGLRAAVHRLLHPPPIDPRSPVLDRLLSAQVPGPRPLVLLADAPDLAIEALMRAHKADGFSIGDTGMDSYVPADWVPRLRPEVAALAPGERIATDAATLALAVQVAAHPGLDPISHPLALGGNEMEWILQQVQRRFRLQVVARAPDHLLAAALVRR
jgi:hypothetical protein